MVSRSASVAAVAAGAAAALAQSRPSPVRARKLTSGRTLTMSGDGEPQLEAAIEVRRRRTTDRLPVPLEVAWAEHCHVNWPGGRDQAPQFVTWGQGSRVSFEQANKHAVVLQVVSSDPEDVGTGKAKGEWLEVLDITIKADPQSIRLIDYERELAPATVDMSTASAILDAVLGIAIRSDNGRVVLGELL